MIVGIGVDIVDVNRIVALVNRFGDRFLKKILSRREIKLGLTDRQQAAYVAKQFAAKEAVSKALGTGMRWGVRFRTIQVLRNQNGAPYVRLKNLAAERARQMGADNIQISLSDEKDYAIAYVVASSN
mgnify:FL=1